MGANNYTSLRKSTIKSTLDQCIKCNICTSACPVMAVTDLFPGPKYVGPQGERFRKSNQPPTDNSVDYCSGCRVFNRVCPTGVKIAEMNARARARMVEQGKVHLRMRLRNNLLAHVELFGRMGQSVAPLGNSLLSNRFVRFVAESMVGIHRQAPLPRFSNRRFTTWWKHRSHPLLAMRKVVFFYGCSTEYFEPRIGKAAVQVLETNGFEVIIPPQNCCGLPFLSNGEFKTARRYHKNNVHNLVEFARRGIPIVGTSTSCTLTLKEEAPDLLDMMDEDTQLVAKQTFDFNEFLLLLLDEGAFSTKLKPIPLTLPYHIPCQYRAHRLGKPGMEVLDLIPELRVIDSHIECCGIAGTYGYKLEKYPISMKVGDPLFEFVSQMKAPVAICDSETCRWQITHATDIPAIHPAELLAASYGYEVEGTLANIMKRFRKANNP